MHWIGSTLQTVFAIGLPVAFVGFAAFPMFVIAMRRHRPSAILALLLLGATTGAIVGFLWISWKWMAQYSVRVLCEEWMWGDTFPIHRWNLLAVAAILGMFASWLSLMLIGSLLFRTKARSTQTLT